MPTPLTPQPSTPATSELAVGLARLVGHPELLEAALQPVVDLRRGTVWGYELLARFPSPPAAGPDAWLRAAVAEGMSSGLEARMVVHALARRAELPSAWGVTVNLSPHAVVSEAVRQALELQPRLDGLVLELTERLPVDDYAALRAGLAPLRERGALVAIDDAGSGYDSLRQIFELRPELVKADRTLVSGVDRDPRRAAVLETLATYAQRSDARLVAEGIERLEELDTVIELGIGLAQGYLLGRPEAVPAPLAPELSEYVRGRSAAGGEGEGVGRLAQPVASAPSGTPAHELVARLLELSQPLLVLVDEDGRPTGLLTRVRVEAGGGAVPATCVDRRAPIPEAARTAMARPREGRFEPLACCDEAGALVGVVRVERLVEALAGGW